MSIPFKVSGAGNNSTARNVYKITFSTALSSAPIYRAWDNSKTFPERDTEGSTALKEIFTGTEGNEYKPMLSLVATTSEAPISNWKPISAVAGSANPNRLKGLANYVTDPTTPAGGEAILFNVCLEVPFDATVPSTSSMNALLEIHYSYTGDAPTVEWYANEGTEETPVWTQLTPGVHGIKFCNANANVNDSFTYKLTLPEDGTVDDGCQIVTS